MFQRSINTKPKDFLIQYIFTFLGKITRQKQIIFHNTYHHTRQSVDMLSKHFTKRTEKYQVVRSVLKYLLIEKNPEIRGSTLISKVIMYLCSNQCTLA